MPPPDRLLKKRESWQDPQAIPYIRIEQISKSYGGTPAINNVSLSIHKNELFCLLGPSGCGKSTLLRILAGFETPSSGRIYLDNIDMTDIPPHERPVNMMFQSYALFPHMNVEQNIAFGLKQDRLSKPDIRRRVTEMLELVRMERYAKRRPDQLSGGQKQRVALARSLAKRPKLVLLDEPLGALDKQLREKTQFELVNIQETLGVTFIMVTHDQEEAMTISTRIGVMEEGRIRQTGTPTEIYEYPNSLYVADFIGEMNIFEGVVLEDELDHVLVQSPAAGCDLYVSHSASAPVNAHVSVAIRPEKVRLSLEPFAGGRNTTRGIVRDIAYLGDLSVYHIELPSSMRVRATVTNQVRLTERVINWDDEVYLSWRPESGVVLTA